MTKLTITRCGEAYKGQWRYGLWRASLTNTTTLTIKGVVAYFRTRAEAERVTKTWARREKSHCRLKPATELVSNCCKAYPRVEVDGTEWNDEEAGICSDCGGRCEYVEVETKRVNRQNLSPGPI